jgi:hypothetical protein
MCGLIIAVRIAVHYAQPKKVGTDWCIRTSLRSGFDPEKNTIASNTNAHKQSVEHRLMSRETDVGEKIPKVKIWRLMGAAYRSLTGLVGYLSFWITVTFVLLLVADVLNGVLLYAFFNDSNNPFAEIFYVWLVEAFNLFFLAPLLIAVHRYIILQAMPDSTYISSYFLKRTWHFIVTVFGIYVLGFIFQTVFLIIKLAMDMPSIPLFALPLLAKISVVALATVGMAALQVIAVRLSIILPAIATEAPGTSLKAAWADLQPVYVRVWLGVVGVALPYKALILLTDRILPDAELSIVKSLFKLGLIDLIIVFQFMTIAGFISHVYLKCAKQLRRHKASQINTDA